MTQMPSERSGADVETRRNRIRSPLGAKAGHRSAGPAPLVRLRGAVPPGARNAMRSGSTDPPGPEPASNARPPLPSEATGPVPSATLVTRPVGRTRQIPGSAAAAAGRSEEHTSELQSLTNLVCRLLLVKKNTISLSINSVTKKALDDTHKTDK